MASACVRGNQISIRRTEREGMGRQERGKEVSEGAYTTSEWVRVVGNGSLLGNANNYSSMMSYLLLLAKSSISYVTGVPFRKVLSAIKKIAPSDRSSGY